LSRPAPERELGKCNPSNLKKKQKDQGNQWQGY
jgi:hypothetical protein